VGHRSVKVLELFPHKPEINVAINEAQQVIFGNLVLQAKVAEQ
jgi:hypothetical protein